MSMYLSPLQRFIRFVIDAAYMESGFLDHLNIAIGNADTYKPSIIKFNPFVTGKSTTLVNASTARTVADGDESLAVGCSEKLASVDVSSESTSYHFDSDPAAFCVPEAIRNKKQCQIRVPPSLYTGKLRLMVQAIYGSKRSDYAYTTVSGWDVLQIAGVTLGINVPTAGLYTAPDGSYWLIKIGTDVTAQSLIVAGGYEAETADPLSEAYKLSRLVPTGTETTLAGSSLTSALSGYDGPLAYGWKFNSTGDEASIVVYGTQTGISAKHISTGATVSVTGIKTKLLKVSIDWDEINLAPIFSSVTSVETGNHLPYTQVKTFYPVNLLSARVMKCLVVDIASHNAVANLIAPIYCYYDKTDTLQVERVKNATYTDYAADYSGAAQNKIVGAPRIQYLSGVNGITYPPRRVFTDLGVSVNSTNYRSNITIDNGQRSEEIYKYPPAIGKRDLGQQFNGAPDTPQVRYGDNFAYNNPLIARWNLHSTNRVDDYAALIIIPDGDANAVIVGTDTRKTAASYQTPQAYLMTDDFSYTIDVWSRIGYNWGSYLYSLNPEWSGSDNVVFSSTTYTTAQFNAAVAGSNYSQSGRWQAVYVHSYDDDFNVYNAGSTSNPGSPLPTLDLTALFEVTAVDPYFYNPLTFKSSYSGAAKWALTGSIGGNNDWAGGVYSTPVGWS